MTNMSDEFEGKVCVVTGSSYGIGYAAAAHFLREGGHVVICARGRERLEEARKELSEIGPRVHAYVVDMSDANAVALFAETVEKNHKGIDVLVNNAFSQDGAIVAETTTEQWLENFAATIHGALYMSRAAIPMMRKRGGGAIVNVSSISGSRVTTGSSGYGAAKAGLEQLTRVIAVEEAGYGIRCNAIVVGGAATPALDKSVQGHYELVWKGIPMQRLADPVEVANVIGFLASGKASYVTAATLHVDGGWSAVLNTK